jgi:hypothetical protein
MVGVAYTCAWPGSFGKPLFLRLSRVLPQVSFGKREKGSRGLSGAPVFSNPVSVKRYCEPL